MKSNTLWALIAGLAVGLLVGRELPRSGGGGSGTGGTDTAKADVKAGSAAVGGGAAPGVVPADWLKEEDLKAGDKMAGMTAGQKYAVLKVMNEKPCDCGCPHGNTAKCLKDDPNCPRAPKILETAIALAKQGKSVDEILAAVKKPADAPGAAPPAGAPQKVEVAAWSPVKGPKNAKVTIVEFSDFQWPFCSRVGPTLKQIEEKYPKDVRIVFRQQPLPFHNNAMPAAEASMAANAQGKFWEMHDKLFANQQALDRPSLEKYAQEIGLNMAKFKADLDGHKYKDQIEKDSKDGTAAGASGTPSFFVNGKPLVGAQPFDAFKTAIDDAIKGADELLKKGTPPDKLYQKILETLPSAPQGQAAPAGGGAEPPAEHVEIDAGNAPSKGPKNAVVTILEFSDFQWPFCSRVGPTLKTLEDEYKGKIRIAFKQQPLPFHDKAQLAAEASLAANAQGKFWEMHDRMFANQQAIDRPGLEKAAQEIGLNMEKFKQALDKGLYKDAVAKDSAEGTKAGASGTPTFFINGYRLVGAQPVDAFKKIIDQELKKKGK